MGKNKTFICHHQMFWAENDKSQQKAIITRSSSTSRRFAANMGIPVKKQEDFFGLLNDIL